MKRFERIAAGGIAISMAVGLMTNSAAAAETIKLTFITGFPPGVTTVGAFIDVFAPKVNEALAKGGKYQIDWNLAHSGQVVKPRGEPEALQSGLGDIGLITTAFHLDRVPLYRLPYVTPFASKDPDVVVAAVLAAQKANPAYEEHWRSIGSTPVGLAEAVDNYVIISKTRLATLGDLKGLKVGAAGPNIPWLQPLGVAGVTSDLAAFYNGLATGIFEAALAWPQAMGGFKLCEPAPHALDADIGVGSIIALNMNVAVYEKLPADVKTAMAEVAAVWSKDADARLLAATAAAYERCKTEFRLQYTKMSDADRVAWAKSLPPFGLDWAKETDAKGMPGTKVLRGYMDELRKANQPIARHWDRE
ncbi:MAG: hypothetical protein AB7M05_20245 [Alphaproteobacteria bacterium]